MNLLLLIIVASALGAMVVWSLYTDRRHSRQDLRREKTPVATEGKNRLADTQDVAE